MINNTSSGRNFALDPAVLDEIEDLVGDPAFPSTVAAALSGLREAVGRDRLIEGLFSTVSAISGRGYEESDPAFDTILINLAIASVILPSMISDALAPIKKDIALIDKASEALKGMLANGPSRVFMQCIGEALKWENERGRNIERLDALQGRIEAAQQRQIKIFNQTNMALQRVGMPAMTIVQNEEDAPNDRR